MFDLARRYSLLNNDPCLRVNRFERAEKVKAVKVCLIEHKVAASRWRSREEQRGGMFGCFFHLLNIA